MTELMRRLSQSSVKSCSFRLWTADTDRANPVYIFSVLTRFYNINRFTNVIAHAKDVVIVYDNFIFASASKIEPR